MNYLYNSLAILHKSKGDQPRKGKIHDFIHFQLIQNMHNALI